MLLDTLIPFQGRNITQAPAGLELPNVSLRGRQAGNGAQLFPAPCLYGMGWFRHFPSVSCALRATQAPGCGPHPAHAAPTAASSTVPSIAGAALYKRPPYVLLLLLSKRADESFLCCALWQCAEESSLLIARPEKSPTASRLEGKSLAWGLSTASPPISLQLPGPR